MLPINSLLDFTSISFRFPDLLNKSRALLGYGDFFFAKSLLPKSLLYFKSLLSRKVLLSLRSLLCFKSHICLALLRSLLGLWLLFCLRVIEFLRKFLLLDRLFLSMLFIEVCLEEMSFQLRSVIMIRMSFNFPRVIILLLLIFLSVLSFWLLRSLSNLEKEDELPCFLDLYDFSSCY